MTKPANGGPGMERSRDDYGLLAQLLAEEGVQPASATDITAGPRPERIPLSFSQELLWLLDRASPGMTAYNVPVVRRLLGPLDVNALQRSFSKLAERHESFRTRFTSENGEPFQVVDPPVLVDLPVTDVSEAGDPRIAAERAVQDIMRRPFDLGGEHLFRPTLVRLASQDHVLIVSTHHIVFDGWSRDLLFRELSACYAAYLHGREPDLEPLSVQYADYAIWQRRYLSGRKLEELLTFWREQLGDVVAPLALPTDHPRMAAPGFTGGRVTTMLPLEMLESLRGLSREHRATVYVVLLAAYMTVLHRYSGDSRVLVGSGSAGRTRRELEGIVGYLNNTLVQRGDFDADPTFSELLDQVRDSALAAYDHQEVPLEKLILELREGKDKLSDAPLFRAVMTMQDTLSTPPDLEGTEITSFGVDRGATKFDLTLLPSEQAEGLLLSLLYRTDLYERETAERFLGHLRVLLESVIEDASRPVSKLPMLTDAEQRDLAAWNSTETDFGITRPVHELLAAQSHLTPDAIAVACGDERITYGALDRRVNRLANRLVQEGMEVGSPVGVALGRSLDAVVALFGVLRAGGCYVPLGLDLPAARLERQLAESRARLVVTRSDLAGALPPSTPTLLLDADEHLSAASDAAPEVAVSPRDLAYVLFTSGSTGTPKGVAVTHANLANYTRGIRRILGAEPEAPPMSFALMSTLSADLGNTVTFPALTTGGVLHVIPADTAVDGPRLAEYLANGPVDVMKITPSHMQALAAACGGAADVLPRRWLVLGGEPCPWALVEEVARVGSCQVLNHYGPTEATVGASTFPAGARAHAPLAATAPLGRPIPNVQMHVLDTQRELVPVGVPGELYIGGAGVAQGYVNRPDLTAERFVQIGDFGRLYRTGDRVRRLPSGDLEFLGRLDRQVKIRGYRVELSEIEQVLNVFPGVERCAVVASPAGAGGVDRELIAYVVPRTHGYARAHAERPTPERLRSWAADQLPDYMVPSAIVLLERLPLMANGKLDLKALPDPEARSAHGDDEPARSLTETEVKLVAIWCEALKREGIGVRENFFEIGGHSLVAIRILGKLSRTFGVRLPLRALFDAPTIERLASVVDGAQSAPDAVRHEGIRPADRKAYPAAPATAQNAESTQRGGIA